VIFTCQAKRKNYTIGFMTAKELERLLAARTGFGAAHLDQTIRALRAAGLLPESRRGRGARALTGADVAVVLIALAAAAQPAKAPAAVRMYAGLRRVGDKSGTTLAEALACAAVDASQAATIRTVLVCRSWPMATISKPLAYDIIEERYSPLAGPAPYMHEAPIFCGLSGRLLQLVAKATTPGRAVEPDIAVAYPGSTTQENIASRGTSSGQR
jgi:hypothetical protein